MLLKKICTGLALALAMNMSSAVARNGMYITLESGYAKQTTITDPNTINARLKEHFPSAYRAEIGYNHDLFPFLGIGMEIARAYLAKVDYHFADTTAPYDAKTTEFLTKLQFHFQRMDYFFKVGVVRDTVTVHFFKELGQIRVNRPEVAVGTAFNINCHFAPTLTYYHIFGSGYDHLGNTPFDIKNGNINAVLLGIRYTF